jgi:CarboxypepD_reg-like domain/von Willebrand factor type A domain/Secretion system C-terminal sorting domain
MRFFYIALLFLLSSHAVSFSQTILIKGKVKNDIDSALSSVTVSVKGTKITSTTDLNGEFSITLQKLPVSLVISAIGYETKELLLKKRDSSKYISVSLSPATAALEEVLVVGYGIARKKDITGSISSISSIRINSGKALKIRGTASHDTSGNEAHGADRPGYARILTAAELSDFKKWALWEGYTKEEFKEWSEHWGIAPTKRYCVQVQNENHKGIAGENVYLIDENTRDTAWRAVTDNTGKAELWANFDRAAASRDNYRIGSGTEITRHPVTFENGINYITLTMDCGHSNIADIAFVVDATGSMGDEIQYLQAELQDVIGGLSGKNKGIDLNLGAVFYRDHGDEYLTRHLDFGRDLAALTQFIKQQSAGGGGDFPEAVDDALTTALDSLHWDAGARAKILFLILDAPPHDEAKDRVKTLVIRAASMGIRMVPVVCSGIDKSTEYLMRSIALATNGSYVFLTDDSGVGDTHLKPTTDNYKVELLNDLLQRVISEMIFMIPCTDSEKMEEPLSSNDNFAKLVVYPNPSAGRIGIKSSEKIKELFIADFTGKVLERVNVYSKDQNWQVDLGRYPSGTYLIEYFTEDKKWGAEKVLLLK